MQRAVWKLRGTRTHSRGHVPRMDPHPANLWAKFGCISGSGPERGGSFCVRMPKGMFSNVFSLSLGDRYQIDLRFTLLVYSIEFDASGCGSQPISWLPSYRYLNRSVLASTRVCNAWLTNPRMCSPSPHRRLEQSD